MKMKKLIKAVALAVCLTMAVPVVAPSVGIETVEAAAKVKLNCTKKSIYEGDSFKLKVTGTSKKVKWSSSNKKVATVSSKGSVKGISKGTCKITATVGGKKYTCKVTVKEYTVPKSRITYLGDTNVQYVSEDHMERFFFSLKDQDKNRVSSSGTVELRIENNGEIVYQKTVKFTPSNFGYWTNAISGERYLCSIDIPISDIRAGKSDMGVLYYEIKEKNVSFDEHTLNIYDLPQKTATFNLPKLPKTVLQSVLVKDIYGKYSNALCDINIDNIETEFKYSYVELKFTGSVTPTIDTIKWTGSDSYYFTVKLLQDGIVVDSKTAVTPSIYLNNKFSCNVTFFDIDNTGEYTVEICSYD